MGIEEEIYNKLVEQFGISAICIKKYGNRKELSWLEFIKGALDLTAIELQDFCGYSSNGLRGYFNREFKRLYQAKASKCWNSFLLLVIEKKYCSSCTSIRRTVDFSKSRSRPDGLLAICKECESTYRLENRDKIAVYGKQYRQENKERRAMRMKGYYFLNKEAIAKYHKRYYQINKESIKKSHNQYYLLNKPVYTARNAKRRATKLQATPN